MESSNAGDFRALTIVAFALMTGLALFIVVVYFLVSSGSQVSTQTLLGPGKNLLLVSAIGLTSLSGSRFLAGKVLAGVPREQRKDFGTALVGYRAGVILRLAMLEGAGFLACVFALLTGDLKLLLVAGFMLAMMWLVRPTETEFAEWRG